MLTSNTVLLRGAIVEGLHRVFQVCVLHQFHTDDIGFCGGCYFAKSEEVKSQAFLSKSYEAILFGPYMRYSILFISISPFCFLLNVCCDSYTFSF